MAVTLLLAGLVSLKWPWWLPRKEGILVLAYHKIGYPPKNAKFKDLWVSPEKFEKQLAYLIKTGYKTLHFSDLRNSQNDLLSKKSVLITFDDGYENNYTYAYPILKKYNAKGNIFLVWSTIGKANHWHNPETEPWINMATAEMIKEMHTSGIVEFGGHTINHPNLAKIPIDQCEWEIRESKKQIEKLLSTQIYAFAYPYGAGARNKEIRGKVFESGYEFDFSFKEGKTPWPWDKKTPIDRLYIKGKEDMLDFILHIRNGRGPIA